jgi:formate/nitrite transporter
MNDIPKAEPDSGPQIVTFDAILPAAMAVRAEDTGARRVAMDPLTVFILSILGGAFVAFGAIFATTVSAGNVTMIGADGAAAMSAGLPFGIVRLLIGLVFCVGLILVVIGGAELFTGNTMIVMGWASRKVTTRALLLNWIIVFAGNFVGSIGTAILLFLSTQYTFGNGAVGLVALNIAQLKTSFDFVPALALGIMCNGLVCLAVWMCYGARTSIDRVATVIFPISAFAAAGFEHCVANMYFIPIGLLIKAGAPDAFWTSIGRTAADFPAVTWSNFLMGNLVPVTLGNIIGGAVMVAAVYWFVYRRPKATLR